MAAGPLDTEYCILGKDHGLVQRAVLKSKKNGHELGNAGRVFPGIDIFGIEDGSGRGIHKNGRFCTDNRALGPAADFIGFNG